MHIKVQKIINQLKKMEEDREAANRGCAILGGSSAEFTEFDNAYAHVYDKILEDITSRNLQLGDEIFKINRALRLMGSRFQRRH